MAEGGLLTHDRGTHGRNDDDIRGELNRTAQAVRDLTLDNREEIRVILVGKVGVGKSSTANTMIGYKKFKSDFSSTSVTKQCHHEYGKLKDKKFEVIDTPGLFDTGKENSTDYVMREIKSCMRLSAPGVHAIILVLSAAMRFTEEDKRCFEEFSSIFGQDFFKYVIVVFTWADKLAENDKTLQQYIGDNDTLKSFLKRCGNRTISFNNNNPDPLENERQLNHLFDAILLVNQNNNYRHYTDKLFEEAEKEMKRKEELILKQKRDIKSG